jgi:hypothetical protein
MLLDTEGGEFFNKLIKIFENEKESKHNHSCCYANVSMW